MGKSSTEQPATTAELTLESVYEQLNTLTDRIKELETELTEYNCFAGPEFTDVRGWITDVEEQADELEAASQETITEDATGQDFPDHGDTTRMDLYAFRARR